MFIHLTTHSAYSLQEGLLNPSELVQAAITQDMPALGLTDHRLLTGAVEFVHACKVAGIQPILGLEINLETGKLALLATTLEGWSNLCRLSSALALQGAPEASCSQEFLEPYSKDLIALSGTQGDNSGQRLEQSLGRTGGALSPPERCRHGLTVRHPGCCRRVEQGSYPPQFGGVDDPLPRSWTRPRRT